MLPAVFSFNDTRGHSVDSAAFQPLLETVRKAAQLCIKVQQTEIKAGEKADREPVTIADFGSQAIICHGLRQHFADDAVVAEEAGDHFMNTISAEQRARVVALVGETLGETVTEADIVAWLDHGRGRETARTWVIDPIDGTKGFLAQRSYTNALGLLEDKQPVAGILGCPGYDDGWLFYAVGGEAHRMPLAGAEAEAIGVSERAPGDGYKVVESVETKHANHALMAEVYTAVGAPTPEVVRVDGQDKYARIAAADADLYLRVSPKQDYREKVWDHAAGVAIIQAAGGTVTDMAGNPLDFSLGTKLENNVFVVVSNGRDHEKVIEALQAQYAK